jgi:cytochrome oxidase assembly protein ShyY1
VYRFLLSRQWVILTLVALALIPAMVWLGFWQLDRHHQRVERNQLIENSLNAPVVPISELTSVGGQPADADRYRRVEATGVFDQDGEVLVRQRTNEDGAVGYYVLTPLFLDDGTGVLVNRGWVEAGDDPATAPEVAAPPRGEVTVTGRLMPDETSGTTGIRERSGLPEGMTMLISSAQRGAELGVPMYGGYVELTRAEPAGRGGNGGGLVPEPLPEPDHTGIGAHFAYAIQWWLFAAGVPVGWVLLLRREIHDRRAAGGPGGGRDGGGNGGPGDDGPGTGDGPGDGDGTARAGEPAAAVS